MERYNLHFDSKDITTAAIKMAISENRNIEKIVQEESKSSGISSCAVDFGGEFVNSISKIIEHAVVAATREKLINASHPEQGAVAGATREAISQIMNKAIGLNVGGKIGIARYKDHVAVSVYFGIGLLNLNEVAIGLGHRVLWS